MKYALIIGNNKYNDPKLAPLKTPEVDSRELAKVLRAKHIGNFDEVSSLIDPTEAKSRRAISAFLSNKKPEDLVLLYFSGHGVLDSRGSLFLALKDTQTQSLNATAISSLFLSYEMDNCRSRRQILILDCCNSGAFARGTKGEQKAVTESTFGGSGSGRVVLTATDSTQFAFEGDQVVGLGQTNLSLFTHFLLEGLKTGEADINNDGKVSLDEWYDYSYAKITAMTPQQIPHKWSYNQQGDLIVAQNPFVKKKNVGLLSSPLRAMLDQKQLDYRQHKLILDSKELDIVAAELEKTELELEEADKQLLLLSSLVHGKRGPWLEMSAGKGLEWLRQAFQDENCPREVRLGAAACLGEMEDMPTYDRLLDYFQQAVESTKRSDWLDLLIQYLNRSEQPHHLSWTVNRSVIPRLTRLRIKAGSIERARMTLVATSVAPICALIAFILSRTEDPVYNIIGTIVVIFIATIVAIIFAQGVTSLALITRPWPLLWQALTMAGIGSALGAILFLFIAGQTVVGLSGGVIALMQLYFYRGKIKPSSIYWTLLAALLIFPFTMLVSYPYILLAKIGYAFSASLFSCVYIYFVGKQKLFS